MGSSTLEKVPPGIRIFVDAPIFIYHYAGLSRHCGSFLERCENGEVQATTSVVVLAEVRHRLMMLEATSRGLVTPGNVVKKLRAKPEIVGDLQTSHELVRQIPLMGIEIVPFDLGLLLNSAIQSSQHGLLTNDAIIAATLEAKGLEAIATGDRDFERIEGITVYQPTDLQGS